MVDAKPTNTSRIPRRIAMMRINMATRCIPMLPRMPLSAPNHLSGVFVDLVGGGHTVALDLGSVDLQG